MKIDWGWLVISTQSNTHYVDILIRYGVRDISPGFQGYKWGLRILRDSPVIYPGQNMIVRKSSFRARHIVHPGGGGATRLVCEECGAEYPYVANPVPCGFCAVMKESGIVFMWGGNKSWERTWSEHGWAIEVLAPHHPAGRYCLFDDKDGKAVRYTSKRAAARYMKEKELDSDVYRIVPYPLKPVMAMVGSGAGAGPMVRTR